MDNAQAKIPGSNFSKANSTNLKNHSEDKNELLQAYIKDSKQYPILTQKEILKAFKRYQEEGCQEAKNLIIVSNLRLAVKIAWGFYHRGGRLSLVDLIQEGNIGLIRAVDKYEVERNVKFSYYASFWIKSYIFRYISDNWRLVNIKKSQDKRKLFRKLNSEKNRLIGLGLDSSAEKIAKNLDVGIEDVLDMEEFLTNKELSLDNPLVEGSEASWIEFFASDIDTEEIILKKDLEKRSLVIIDHFRKEKLSERELFVFNNRICCEEESTLQKIGDQLNLTREMIRQIEKKIYRKLREFKEEEEIKSRTKSESCKLEVIFN